MNRIKREAEDWSQFGFNSEAENTENLGRFQVLMPYLVVWYIFPKQKDQSKCETVAILY